ncbi:hypothetical protein QR680_018217 [Steinernema hermaphroditum]|uniref:Nuclear receptor domain-containing protein n=1 Tax=Steinernema hermaphroditum TaxID=289476 RepID=A0AA39HJB5_9BILA|nr:hypothetical protein QR680_018217 [Steinernema hermaphroditum]
MSTCLVCNDISDGLHFGIHACRACAAFFRRSTVTNRKYVCRFNNQCDIGKDVRCMCRACRMQKCIDRGMNPKNVQRHRDGIGSRTAKTTIKQETIEMTASPTADVVSIPPLDQIPIATTAMLGFRPTVPSYLLAPATEHLTIAHEYPTTSHLARVSSLAGAYPTLHELQPVPLGIPQTLQIAMPTPMIDRMVQGYEALKLARKGAPLPGDNVAQGLFDEGPKTLLLGDYDYWTAAMRVNVTLVPEMLNEYFGPFGTFTKDQKLIYFKNFLSTFLTADEAFGTSLAFPLKGDQRILISDRRYFRVDQMEQFYKCKSCPSDQKETAKLFQPLYASEISLLKEPMSEMIMSTAEYVALLGICLFGDCKEGASGDSMEKSESARQALYRELYTLCKARVGDELVCVRFGTLMNFVPTIMKIVSRFTESFGMVKLFNIFEIDVQVYNLDAI